jgi:hypothetical protein
MTWEVIVSMFMGGEVAGKVVGEESLSLYIYLEGL